MPTLFTNIDKDKSEELNYKTLFDKTKNEEICSIINNGCILSLNKSITDQDLESLFIDSIYNEQLARAKNLNITLEAYSKITDNGIITLIHNCSGIKKINLKSCMAITDKSIIELSKKCPDLEEINLSWCNISANSVIALADNCPKLKKINLRSCYITDSAIIKLVSQCKELKSICLPWCKSLTDISVIAIADNIPNITMLDLRGNEKITSKGILYISERCRYLEVLHLKRSPYATTDESLIALSTNNPRLQKVNLRGCFKILDGNIKENITSHGIIALTKNCPELSLIDIAWQENLEDAALISIANNCPKIESIDISGCSNITDIGIIELAKKSKFLKKLILFKNKLITENSINMLKNSNCIVMQY